MVGEKISQRRIINEDSVPKSMLSFFIQGILKDCRKSIRYLKQKRLLLNDACESGTFEAVLLYLASNL